MKKVITYLLLVSAFATLSLFGACSTSQIQENNKNEIKATLDKADLKFIESDDYKELSQEEIKELEKLCSKIKFDYSVKMAPNKEYVMDLKLKPFEYSEEDLQKKRTVYLNFYLTDNTRTDYPPYPDYEKSYKFVMDRMDKTITLTQDTCFLDRKERELIKNGGNLKLSVLFRYPGMIPKLHIDVK